MSDHGKYVRLLDPTSGQVDQVDPDQAMQLWTSGKRQLVPDDQLAMVADDGTTALVPAAQVQDMTGRGWRFANRHDVLKGAAGDQPIRSAVEGAMSALTLGGSDYVMKKAGVEGLAERRDTAAGLAGEAGGIGLTVLGPSILERMGVGLAKGTLAAALAPTMALDAAGAATEALASRALEGVIANRAITGALSAGLGAAITNGGFAFGGALAEEALGDHDVNAEHLLAAAGGGALLGGALGAAGGGLRGMLEAKASRKAVTELTPQEGVAVLKDAGYDLTPKAAESVWTKALRLISKGNEAAGYDIEKVNLLHTPYARATLHDAEGAVETAGRDLQYAIAGVEKNREASIDAAYERRGAAVSEYIPKGATGTIIDHVADTVDALRGKLKEFVRDPELGLTESAAASQTAAKRRMIDALESDLFKAAGVPRTVKVTRRVEVPAEPIPVPADEHAFARKAVSLLESGQVRGVGDRAWIHELRAQYPELSTEQFLSELDKARRADTLRLSRRDLVTPGVMADMASSEVGHTGTGLVAQPPSDFTGPTFHQVRPGVPIPEAPKPGVPAAPTYREETVIRKLTLHDLAAQSAGLPESLGPMAFTRLDKIKQLLKEDSKFAAQIDEAGARNRATYYRDMYGTLRNHLEDTSVYGEAGDFQRETNEAYLNVMSAQRDLRKAFGTEDLGSKQVSSYLQNMSKFRGDDAVQALEKWRGAQEAYAASIDKWIPNAGIGGKTREALGIYDKAHVAAGDAVGVKSALDSLIKQRNKMLGFQGKGAFGALLGGAVGAGSMMMGPVAGAAAVAGGALMSAVLDPGRFAQAVASAERIKGRVASFVNNRAARLAGEAVDLASESFPRVVSRATRAMFDARSAEERQKAYEERISELESLARSYPDHARQQLLGVADKLPNHAASMTAVGDRAMRVLLAHIPAPRAGTASDIYSTPRPLDRDVARFAKIDQAVQDPLGTLDRLARGEAVTAQEVAAVEQAYPRLVAGFRQATMIHLGGGSKKPPLALQRAQRIAFGLPPADPTHLSAWQAVHAAPPAPPPQAPGAAERSHHAAGPHMPSLAPLSVGFASYPELPRQR